MAKNKKSKILASMLAVSTMAVFYAAPVMAEDLSVTLDGQGITADEITVDTVFGQVHEYHDVIGTLTITESALTTALAGTDLTLDSVTANTISTTGNNFIVGTDGNVSANSVTTSGDVVTLSGDVLAGTYSLKDIGVRTQNMTATEGNTVFTGNVSATGTMSAVSGDFGGTVINAQGINAGSSETFQIGQINVSGRNLSNVGYISGDTLNFKTLNMGKDGNDTLAQITGDKVRAYNTAINAETGALTGADGSVIGGVEFNGNGTIEAANGAFSVDTNGNVTANRVTIGDTVVTGSSVTTDYLLANSADIDGVLISGGLVDGVDVSALGGAFDSETGVVGGISRQDRLNEDGILDTTIIEDTMSVNAEGMEITNADGEVAVAAGTDGSFSAANGAFDVNENGEIEANFSETGTLYADEIGFDVEHYTSDHSTYLSAYEDYVSMSYNDADQYNEVTVDENRAGLTHSGENNFSRVSVSDSGVGLIYVSEDPDAESPVSTISMTDEGIEFSGKVYTGNANDFSFTYNGYTGEGGLTIENGTVAAGTYTLDDLVDTVADIYERTQGISYDSESGTTTIDGNLNVSGDAETGEGGNENVSGDINAGGDITADGDVNGSNGNFDKVSTDEIAVGDNTFIDGDSVNSNEGNFKDKVTVGEAGDQTVIDGGTITTGDTIIKGDGINVGEGTHIGDGVVSSTNGNFDNINSNTGTIGNATFGKDNTIFGTGDNQTTINNDGVTVGGEEGTSIKNDSISVGDGGYIGDGDVRSGEGVSLNQTAERVGNLENRVGELEDRIDKVGAMAAAIANLRTMGYDPAAPTEVAVGIGQYRDETGAALGLFHYPNRDFMLSLSVSTSGDEVMGGIGATWKFGRKSPEKVAEIKKAQAEADVRRAEEAKLAKAEEMKQAAKEAKIKAQQERHAKLAAERAAQAEAAK